MRFSRSILAALGVALAAPAAHAQRWTGPMFSSPMDKPRLEVTTSDAYGAGVGFAVAARPFASAPGLRLRLGVADGLGTGLVNRGPLPILRETYAFSLGADYAAPLAGSADSRLRADWVAGVGLGKNGGSVVSIPLGVSVGYQGDRIRPYVTPRVVLDHRSGSLRRLQMGAGGIVPDDGFDAGAVIDWGVDVRLVGRGLMRLAVTTGNWNGVGLGFSF